MIAKGFIKCPIFFIILIISFSVSSAELYSGGPWGGRVIDADTKEPIEGAVVVAIWRREYDSFPDRGAGIFLHEIKETLTDKDGQFEIPAYVESGKDRQLWKEKDLEGSQLLKLAFIEPKIRKPEFIIYKPSYGAYEDYPSKNSLLIFAICPSKVEYLEEYKEIYKGHEISTARKKTMKFPDGLVYVGERCEEKIKILKTTTPFRFKWLFTPLKNAKERIEKMDIPLDCPEKGQPVPERDIVYGHKSDIKDRPMENGYVIVELPKLKTREERMKLLIGPIGGSEYYKKQKLLIKLLNEENKNLGIKGEYEIEGVENEKK
ncbi:MAG: hypothetical protein AB1638_00420 [Nitrospirota bacterium]